MSKDKGNGSKIESMTDEEFNKWQAEKVELMLRYVVSELGVTTDPDLLAVITGALATCIRTAGTLAAPDKGMTSEQAVEELLMLAVNILETEVNSYELNLTEEEIEQINKEAEEWSGGKPKASDTDKDPILN